MNDPHVEAHSRQAIPFAEARRRWNRPPRPHGDINADREVSFLELFYDLVYVVIIAQIAHTLAVDVTWGGVGRFAVVFVLIWFAWFNGSMYHELHGGEDGRSRTFIFVQMWALAVIAVYAAHAADRSADARGFALGYAALLGVFMVQWFQVYQQDADENRSAVVRYVSALALTAVVMVASAFVDDPSTAAWMWAAVMATTGLIIAPPVFRNAATESTLVVTPSMVERYGLFTIIMLGEVVVGVVDGLSEADRTVETLITAVVALNIGFGVWWTYFDFTGRKVPRPNPVNRGIWMSTHLPLHAGIAALGAGLVSFVAQAAAARPTVATSWLVGGSLAVTSACIAVITATMRSHPGRALAPRLLLGSAAVALAVAALRPPPIVSVLVFATLFAIVWFEAFIRHARHGHMIAGDHH